MVTGIIIITVLCIVMAVYAFGRKAGKDSAGAKDAKTIRNTNVNLDGALKRQRSLQREELSDIRSARDANSVRNAGRKRSPDS
jgi:hypothetical protein